MKKKIVKKKDLKKKKKKRKKVNKIKTIFILLCIFIILMGVLLIFTLSHEDSNNDGALIDDVIHGEIVKLDLTNKTVNKLYHLFLEDNSFKKKYAEGLNKSIDSRLYYTYLSLVEDDFEKIGCNDVGLVILFDEDGSYKALCSMNTTFSEEIDVMEKEIRENSTFGIDASKFKEKYQSLFGEVPFETTDFYYIPGQIMHYDSLSNMYLKYYSEYGSEPNMITGEFKDATLRGKKLKITINYYKDDLDEIEKSEIIYHFEKDKKSGKYIFMNREEI